MPAEPLPLLDPVERPLPTIRDVARSAGVSIASVSRALNAHRECAPETRERIIQIAQELGYHRNLAASLLGATGKSGRSNAQPVVGMLSLPAADGSPPPTSHKMLYGQAFQATGQLLGRHTEHRVLNDLSELAAGLQGLRRRGCIGILLDLRTTEPYWETIAGEWNRFAVVTLDSEPPHSPFHQVRRTHFDDLWQIWERLVRLGYQRIGAAILQHPYPEITDRQRIGAVLSCQDAHPELPVLPPLRADFHEAQAPFKDWMQTTQPDVVIGFGIGTWWWMDQLGLTMPKDVGLATLHGGGTVLPIGHGVERKVEISGMHLPYEIMMQAAIPMLDTLVTRRQLGIPSHRTVLEVNGRWHEGQTLRPQTA